MSGVKVFLLIFGMMLVTYIPRAIPAILMDKLKFSPKVEKFLKLIPYTAMAALIFPGVFTADAHCGRCSGGHSGLEKMPGDGVRSGRHRCGFPAVYLRVKEK